MRNRTTLRNYEQARALLVKRNKQGHYRAKLQNNVYLEWREDGIIAIIYHKTDIVTYYPDGRIDLDTGGWSTVTTKANMNRFSPFYVFQHKFVWYINTVDHDGANPEEIPMPSCGFITLQTPTWASELQTA